MTVDAEPRVILHVDMDAFFVSVALLDRPDLRGRPVLTGGSGSRGVVTSASYEARQFGCRSAMPMAVARRLCPDAVILPTDGERVRQFSRMLFAILDDYSPTVQPLSVDEAFVDLTGTQRLLGDPVDVAETIRRRIRAETGGLTASIGIAPNKFLAKTASEENKPDGLTRVTADQARAWLADKPISRLWGIGRISEPRLIQRGIRTIGDILRLDDAHVRAVFGDEADHFRRLAAGLDDRPVVPDRQAKSIGHEQTFGEDLTDPAGVRGVLLGQVEQIGWRLRRRALRAGRMTVKIRFADFRTITRARTLDTPTDLTDDLWTAAAEVFDHWAARGFQPVRLIGASAGQLITGEQQLSMFDAEQRERRRELDHTLDAIFDRFGKHAVTRAGTMKRGDADQTR